MTDGVVFRWWWLGSVGIFKIRSTFSPTHLTAVTWTLLDGKIS